MSSIEAGLAQLRADLCAVVARDLRRRAHRRRLWQLGLVPALALGTSGAALAVIPSLGQRAPGTTRHVLTRLEQSRSDLRDQNGRPLPPTLGPDAQRLTLVARGDGHVLYAERHDGIRCAVTVLPDGRPDGWQCEDPGKGPGAHGINLISLGGGSARDTNYVSGRVGNPDARTVHVRIEGIRAPVTAQVGLDGYFIAQMPDALVDSSPSRRDRPPSVTVTATDAVGRVVATTSG